MKPWHGAVLFAAGLGGGFAFGSATSNRAAAPTEETASLRGERDALKIRAERAETELASAREAIRRPRDGRGHPAGEVPPGSRFPVDAAPRAAVSPVPEKPAGPTAAERTKRRDDLVREMRSWFENHDGAKALAGLKELAALVPEGRDAAMKLALDINKDVEGAGALRLPMQTFYMGLGDPAVRDLMAWSLENQASSSADFRVLSAWSLPWTQAPIDDTVSRFDAALAHEPDPAVQKALVANLGQINSPDAEAALVRVLGDGTRDAALHGDVAMALATSDDPAAQRAVAAAAAADSSNQRVQTAAKLSLIVRDPPATGCLVVQTTPDGTADSAGVRAGDVIVSYNGRAVPTETDLSDGIKQAAGADTVPLVVVRDGAQQTLQVKPTRIDRGTAIKPLEKK